MREEVLADNVRLILGDCREVIPTLKGINAVISDPPYGIEDLVGGYGRKQLAIDPGKDAVANMGKTSFRHIANDRNLDVVEQAFTLLRKQLRNAWVAAFYSCRITPAFFKVMAAYEYFGEIIWDKRMPGMGSQIRYQHENIAFFKVGKPQPLWDCMSVVNYMAIKSEQRSEGSGHPHEKPAQVMENIVRVVPGKMVLDPFMGTGSTGAAAVKLKRGFVGIEIDPKHYEIAIKKVSAAIRQPVAFWE